MAIESLVIFDTTLRDGEQTPGVTLTVDEKVQIAKQLSLLGVDVCEAGFPIASEGDFEAVARIAELVGPLTVDRETPMTICALARAKRIDIQRAYDAVKSAPQHRIHTFLASSDLHLNEKLKISREECLKQTFEAVSFAKSLCQDVQFSAEDATRSDLDFLIQVFQTAVDAGATTLNVPDTVGYHTPELYAQLIQSLISAVKIPSSQEVIWSTHCHDDLGLATANTAAGVLAGARQCECTINGLGERAGNTPLEELLAILLTHPHIYAPSCLSLNTHLLQITSDLVSRLTGVQVARNKAVVGKNAFVHESGVHADGVLKNRKTYEMLDPKLVGKESVIVLGKHSGRNALRNHVTQLGYSSLTSNEKAFDVLFKTFKALADIKKHVSDEDIVALIQDVYVEDKNQTWTTALKTFTIHSVQVVCAHADSVTGDEIQTSTATVSLSVAVKEATEIITDASTGFGSIHALFSALARVVQKSVVGAKLQKMSVVGYDVSMVGEGGSAKSLGKAVVRLVQKDEHESGRIFVGTGTHWDILMASAKAYIGAVNQMVATEHLR